MICTSPDEEEAGPSEARGVCKVLEEEEEEQEREQKEEEALASGVHAGWTPPQKTSELLAP